MVLYRLPNDTKDIRIDRRDPHPPRFSLGGRWRRLVGLR